MRREPELWRAYEANEITHSGAHYLLAVAALSKEGTVPRAADVARHLGVSRAAVSLQIRALAAHRLLRLDPRQRLKLTRSGADLVARIAGKREVVRTFLGEILDVSARTSDLDACKVEHLLSEETGASLVRLIRFLRSSHPAATAFLRAWHESTQRCPPERRCELCTGVCLLEAGGVA